MLMKSKGVSESLITISEKFSYLIVSLLKKAVEHLEVEGVCRLKLVNKHFKPVHIAFEGAVNQLHRDDCQHQFLAFCKN